ncbi:hypothetical protein FBBAL38_02100 [Flavobacteria bacterium BAL38]|nr:hypothetical protein FBBAL38_02100 [Flavobacteria bacterium BAL38]
MIVIIFFMLLNFDFIFWNSVLRNFEIFYTPKVPSRGQSYKENLFR